MYPKLKKFKIKLTRLAWAAAGRGRPEGVDDGGAWPTVAWPLLGRCLVERKEPTCWG